MSVFEIPGVCIADGDGAHCVYRQIGTLPCDDGCSQDGLCTDDPCIGITCVQPVTRTCTADLSGLIAVGGAIPNPGACRNIGGEPVCRYDPISIDCDEPCFYGQCPEKICSGLTCGTPPAAYCEDETTLVTFEETGTGDVSADSCDCAYPTIITACPGGCDAGRCIGTDLDGGV